MSRVFVIQSTKHQADVSPASSYGTIMFVLGPGDRSSSNPDLSLRKLMAVLDNFVAEEDFILWSGGDPLSCMLTGIALAELGITKFTYLRYERTDRKRGTSTGYYVPIEVDFDD